MFNHGVVEDVVDEVVVDLLVVVVTDPTVVTDGKVVTVGIVVESIVGNVVSAAIVV